MDKTVSVYHSDNGWAVKRIGGGASKLFPTQREAIECARSIARKTAPSQIAVYARSGMVRMNERYGLPSLKTQRPMTPRSRQIRTAIGKYMLDRFANDPHPPRE